MRLCDYHPSFGLAVAVRVGTPGYWLQVTAPRSQIVAGFSPLSINDTADVDVIADRPIQIGDAYIHAFLDLSGGLYLDTASDLQVVFNVALNSSKTSNAVKLAISEQLEDSRRTRALRERLIAVVGQTFGSAASQSFGNSTARAQLWELLEASAVSAIALARIRRARPRVLAHLAPDGSVDVDLDAVDAADLKISKEDIVSRLAGAFERRPPDNRRLPRVDLSGLPGRSDPSVANILEAVELSPRQEERLAILIRSLLIYPTAGRQALQSYQDSAAFAQGAVGILRGIFDSLPIDADERTREQQIYAVIPKLISRAYPRRRGAILFYFAEHLADFPIIASQIRRITERSQAFDVNEARSEIEAALDAESGADRYGKR